MNRDNILLSARQKQVGLKELRSLSGKWENSHETTVNKGSQSPVAAYYHKKQKTGFLINGDTSSSIDNRPIKKQRLAFNLDDQMSGVSKQSKWSMRESAIAVNLLIIQN